MDTFILSEPQPLVRSFKISDPTLTAFARVYRELFLEDDGLFGDLNPEFQNDFAAAWLEAITNAEDTPSDETMVDIQIQQTNGVLSVMSLCRRKYNEIIYYVEEAFSANIAVQNEFGRNDFVNVRQQQDGMINFMSNLYRSAGKYNAQLLAKGCTQDKIDEILTLKNSLIEVNTDQQKLIKERPTATADRIAKHNLVYSYCQKVNRASKRVFADNYAKIQQYLLPASENQAADIAFTGVVTRQEDSAPIENATAAIAALDLTAQTDNLGVFAFAQEIPDGTYNFAVTADGRQDYTGSVTITDGETVTRNVAMIAAP